MLTLQGYIRTWFG